MSETINIKQTIYKIKRIVNGSLNSIYVFNAKKEESNKEIFKEIFSESEAEQIQSEGVKVIFSQQEIHSDDSIGTIKVKIVDEFKKEI